jgi:molybdopterin molybdotransferase
MPSSHHTRVLPFEQARQVVEEHAKRLRPKGRELLLLLDGAGRVLAEDIHADRDIPPFARATRDGYALRAADVLKLPANLDLVAEVRAGVGVKDLPPLEPGEAISIMTGAEVPNGADAVLMIEYSSREENRVEVTKSISAGENIVPAGAEGRRGDLLLSAGTPLDYATIALAAAVGRARVLVHEKPRVAVLSTGDEVVDIDVVPGPNQIRNSNSYSLAAQIAQAGAEAVLLPIAPDEPARLRELLAEAFDSDLVLIAGGVSMGRYDLVEQELAALQAEFFFSGANIQPGKPIVFGRVEPGTWAGHPGQQPKYFFGLPGNPISTMVTFELFAKVLVQALAGIGPQPLKFLHAKLGKRVHTKTGLKRFLPARVSGEFENAQVELTPWQGSGDIASVARSNCFLVIGPDRESIEAGEWVPVLLR